MTSAPAALTPSAIARAAQRLAPHVLVTPCEPSPWLSALAGRPVVVKWESLQRTGSFKLRGALHKLLCLAERGVRRVLAVSAGNHGLGVARAARLVGMQATVVVPGDAVRAKVDAIRREGAELLVRGASYDEAEVEARALAAMQQVEFVSPYNDVEVIAGQATVVWELFGQLDEDPPARLLVPVGGGGLVAGAALAAIARCVPTVVVGVQPAAATAMHSALAAGRLVPVQDDPTIADGLTGNIEADSVTFPLVRDHVAGVVLVPEAAIERAVADVLAYDHHVVEGSGAVGVAALLDEEARRLALGDGAAGGSLAVVVTGRNIDLGRLVALAARHVGGA